MGKLFLLIGKSASGKDNIFERLLQIHDLGLRRFLLYTTRPMRDGETQGKEYYFTDVKSLETMERQGKVIEKRVYSTVYGPWYYFTADNGELTAPESRWLGIGTLESLAALKGYYGEEVVIPLYIEVEDGIRLERALFRERIREKPQYEEMCRRFLADQKDFSEQNIRSAGIRHRFSNEGEIGDCISQITAFILDH